MPQQRWLRIRDDAAECDSSTSFGESDSAKLRGEFPPVQLRISFMNAADYTIVAVLAVSLVLGMVRGFIREAIGVLALLGGVWLAWRYAHWVAPMLGGLLDGEPVRTWVARGVVLAGVVFFAWLVSGILSYFIHQSGLSTLLDRLLGALFGLLRGVVMVALTAMLSQVVQLNEVSWWKQSKLLPYAVTVSHWIGEFAESARSSEVPSSQARSKRQA